MTRSKLGLLVLCVAALGTIAIFASSAQAALSWLVLNKEGTVATEVKSEEIITKEKVVNLLASVTAENDSAKLTFLTKLVGVKIGVSCTAFTTAGINLEPEGKLSGGAKVIFTGCFVSEGATACTVKTLGAPAGTIEGNKFKGELVLHEIKAGEKEVLVKLESESGPFATVLFEGIECTLPSSNPFSGVIYFKDSEKFATTHKVKHLLEIGPLTSLLLGKDTAEHLETTIDGSVWVKLGGAHVGLAWAGMDNGTALSWLVLNKEGTVATEVKSEEKIVKEEKVVNLLASVTAENDSAKLTFLTKLVGVKIGVSCTAFTTAGINLEPEGKLSGGAKVIFTGCFVSEGATACTVKTLGAPAGTIEGNKFKGELILHEIKAGEKEVLVKLESESGSFATVLFEGKECTLPLESPFSGVIYLKDSEKFATTHKVKHLLEIGPLTSLLLGKDTAEHLETTIDGSVWVKLGGAHAGLAWAGMDNTPPPKLSWLVLNETGTVATEVKSEGGKVNLPASVMAESDSLDLTLLTKLVGVKVGVSCTTVTAAGINLEPEGKLSEEGKAILTGCFVSEGGAKCTVKSSGAPTDTIESTELKGELVLHEIKAGEKEVLVKLEPKSASGGFTTLVFAGECSLPESKVSGVVYLKDSEKFATTHKVKHLLEVGPLTSLYVGSDTAEHLETTIDGSVWAKLGGAHFGLAWAGMDA